jgi:hypothetical protein
MKNKDPENTIKEPVSKTQQIKRLLENVPERLENPFKRAILKVPKRILMKEVGSLSIRGVIDLEEKVPNLLFIGELNSTGGIEIGKGELLAALAFKDGKLNVERNGPYDVVIEDTPWHIKAYNPNHGLRFSNKEEHSIRNTDIFQQLPERLQYIALEINNTDLVLSMQKWYKQFKLHDENNNLINSDYHLFDTWSKQCVQAALGEAIGVIWFYNNHFVVSHARDLIFFGTTQDGRIVLKCNKLFAKDMTLMEPYTFDDMKERVLK